MTGQKKNADRFSPPRPSLVSSAGLRTERAGGQGGRCVSMCLSFTPLHKLICPVHRQGTVQFHRSVISNSVTPWTAARQASLSITNSRSLLRLMCIESVMPSNDLILCRPLLLLPSLFPSNRVFSNESILCIRWPKCWSFSFSISPSNEYSGLISLRMDWLDLLAVQGTLKSPLTPQFKSIDSLALSFLSSPTLTFLHDHWKNHSFD